MSWAMLENKLESVELFQSRISKVCSRSFEIRGAFFAVRHEIAIPGICVVCQSSFPFLTIALSIFCVVV